MKKTFFFSLVLKWIYIPLMDRRKIMSRFFLLLTIYLFPGCQSDTKEADVQSEFEGVIVYTVSTNSNNLEVFSNEELRNNFGDTVTFYYKAGKYRMSFNGKDLSEAFYFSDKNIEYTLRRGIDTLFYGDCSVNNDELKEVEERENVDTLLGLPCDQVRVKGEKYSRTYVYSPTLYLDPVHFKNHVLGFANEYYSRAKAPFLAYTYEGRVFSTHYRAIRIQEKVLQDSLFELPGLPQKRY
ncbi:MAG TPA: hypothetical protein DIW47_11420 [Bacteroidetes bacterium]|nr:hypothetical protein [Bacteroidota bacterium]